MGRHKSYHMNEPVPVSGCKGLGVVDVIKQVWSIRSVIIVVLAFVIPCYLLLSGSQESRCAYVIIVMAILWLTEAIPIPVTSLMPIFLFPMVGVLTAKQTSSSYVNDTTMLFLGGLIVAVAVEETQLHRRLALGILSVIGTTPSMLMLGLMLPTWFLSMWISNTAATAMMVPLVIAIVSQMKSVKIAKTEIEMQVEPPSSGENNPGFDMDIADQSEKGYTVNGLSDTSTNIPDEKEERTIESDETDTPDFLRLCKGLTLCVAYGANIGGISTLNGTPPNLVLKGQADGFYEEYGKKFDGTPRDSGITFANWMGFAFPLSLITLILGWCWLQLMFIGPACFKCKQVAGQGVKRVIQQERNLLGPIRFAEIVVIIIFVALAVLWIFRKPPNIDGWGVLFLSGYVSDSTASIFMSCLLFILPAKAPNVFCWTERLANGKLRPSKYTPILDWKVASLKLPWGVLLLLGGGFALALASRESGLSAWLGEELKVFQNYEPWQMNLVFSAIVACATEVTSNTATATLLMPILFEMGVNIGYHPLYFMITACVACSFAFMLPVATPPNAIVFSTGYVRIPDMALAGIMMNVIGIGVLALAMNTWAPLILQFEPFPEIFMSNHTIVNGSATVT